MCVPLELKLGIDSKLVSYYDESSHKLMPSFVTKSLNYGLRHHMSPLVLRHDYMQQPYHSTYHTICLHIFYKNANSAQYVRNLRVKARHRPRAGFILR